MDFRLFETMRVTEGGEVFLLERHLDRLRNSAKYFSFEYDSGRLRTAIVESIALERSPCRLRLTLANDGEFDIEIGPVPADAFPNLKLSRSRVNSQDPFLYHKTTNRAIYAEGNAVLINERAEATEISIANIAVLREGRWITPPVTCGLLPGVLRAELLSRGEIEEGVVPAGQLRSGERIRCFNALRGVFDVPLRDDAAGE